MSNVKLGQVYSDNDPRVNRIVRVIEILDDHVRVENIETGRKSKVRISRLNSKRQTGYTYEGMSK